jgi:predicted metal-dependent phosphoesterase TrpH
LNYCLRSEIVSRVDLHIHSNASDGRYSPAEVVRKSAEAGLVAIALTDHDTVDGIVPALEAARAFPQLKVLPGVEINTDVPRGEAHVLGYFIDYTHLELLATLGKMRASRQERAQKMIAKLKNLGMPVDWERVREIAGTDAIGRPHIAQVMLERGYISSIKEAFTKYIGWGGPAYVERAKVTPVEAVELILRASGLPVFAHPLTVQDPEAMVAQLKAKGLVGIEAYYDSYPGTEVNSLLKLTKKYSLIATGGSDYHGLDDSAETVIGGVDVPEECVGQLITLAKQRGLKFPKEWDEGGR